MTNWTEMNNGELRDAIKRIVNSSKTREEVNQRAKEELNYPYTIAVSYSKPNAAGQRMSQFMAYGKNNIVLR